MVRFKECWTIIDLDRLIIIWMLVYKLDVILLFGKVVRMISVMIIISRDVRNPCNWLGNSLRSSPNSDKWIYPSEVLKVL